jgi:hypothetical protein
MKKWYKSKVLWFNVAVAIGAAIETSLTLVEGYFDPRVFLALIGLTAGVNVVLRFMTTTGVSK